MDPNVVKAVIKNNVMDKLTGVYNSKSSVVSLSSIDDDDGERSYSKVFFMIDDRQISNQLQRIMCNHV